jgi:hypothetical protein
MYRAKLWLLQCSIASRIWREYLKFVKSRYSNKEMSPRLIHLPCPKDNARALLEHRRAEVAAKFPIDARQLSQTRTIERGRSGT